MQADRLSPTLQRRVSVAYGENPSAAAAIVVVTEGAMVPCSTLPCVRCLTNMAGLKPAEQLCRAASLPYIGEATDVAGQIHTARLYTAGSDPNQYNSCARSKIDSAPAPSIILTLPSVTADVDDSFRNSSSSLLFSAWKTQSRHRSVLRLSPRGSRPHMNPVLANAFPAWLRLHGFVRLE